MIKESASDSATVTITTKHINHNPIANAGQDKTVSPGDIVTVDSTASSDPDSDPITYSWIQTSGLTVAFNGNDTATPSFTAPSNISADTVLRFRLAVKDIKNATRTDNVNVTVKHTPPPNQAPIANSGLDQRVNASTIVHLDARKSKDPDGNITSYLWTQTAGPSVTLNGSDKSSSTFTAPSDLTADTDLTFKLTVIDDRNGTSYDDVKVMVKYVPPSEQPSVMSDQAGVVPNQTMTNETKTAEQQSTNETTEYPFVRKWGSQGSGDGQLSRPHSIDVDSNSGHVYVADSGNYRVQKFTTDGGFITKWGSCCFQDGQFLGANGLSVDSSGNVYVTDTNNNRIQKFDSNGNFITKSGGPSGREIGGTGDGQFQNPEGIAVDSSDNVYVADSGNSRIQKFDSNGNFITKWGSEGTGDGQFYGLNSIATDSSGNVYSTEFANRIQKFDSSGNFITKWGSEGTGDGEFDNPTGIAVDSSGNVYVADYNNDRIQKFDSNGTFITKWGSEGTGDGQFNYPDGIAVDFRGNVYVTDNVERVQVFAPSSN